jgi:hypothetical protein
MVRKKGELSSVFSLRSNPERNAYRNAYSIPKHKKIVHSRVQGEKISSIGKKKLRQSGGIKSKKWR